MATLTLREVIGRKLADGQLPSHSIPRVWRNEGNGRPCNACDRPIERPDLANEGEAASGAGSGVRFHAGCFYIWETLRTMAPAPATT